MAHDQPAAQALQIVVQHPQRVEDAFRANPQARLLAFVMAETSTGALTPIAEIRKGISAPNAEVVDGTGRLAMPGMVNAHSHAFQRSFAGLTERRQSAQPCQGAKFAELCVHGMNAVSFVAYCGQLSGLPKADAMQRAHEVLYYVGLGEARYRNVETYSTGMKQRIKLAQAIVHDPDLLFLDEPTNGMDPKGRDEMLELIHDLAHKKNVNLILSSHLLPDVEYTCDHVVVMDKGTVATFGPIAALKGTGGRVFEMRVKGDQARFIEVLAREGYEVHDTDEDILRVFVPGVGDEGAKLLFALAAREQQQVRHLRPSMPTLEDVFARAVGEL